jgi:hypothetical protein
MVSCWVLWAPRLLRVRLRALMMLGKASSRRFRSSSPIQKAARRALREREVSVLYLRSEEGKGELLARAGEKVIMEE